MIQIIMGYLYIVEYANMNGQLNVNDQLTAEGYKQGGLGAGATDGVISVNGASVYSVFTCGCTDSLGNGSGQITQQFSNTDAEGTVTSTVTRKANRYRGIENPCSTVTVNNWYKDLQYTPQFELFVAPGTGTHNQSSNYFTDYTYSSNSTANRTVFIGGSLGDGSSGAAVGCRLVYLP